MRLIAEIALAVSIVLLAFAFILFIAALVVGSGLGASCAIISAIGSCMTIVSSRYYLANHS
jgi:hypothetical protein